MRHAKKGRALGTDASHTTAILRGLARALFISERIKTTEARAKEVRGLVDKIIGWGKRGDVAARRLAFAEREGGYTRILKLGPRKGDAAPMVILELVE
jgi:large subunit ribosomal protein L17